MKKFVVAYLSLHDGELVQEIVEANSALEAGLSYLNWWDEHEEDVRAVIPKTLEDLYNEVYNGDCFINVLELKHERTGRPGGGLQNQIAGFDSRARVQ